MSDLDKDCLTKKKILSVLNKVKKWGDTAKALSESSGTLLTIEQMNDELKRLLAPLGLKQPSASPKNHKSVSSIFIKFKGADVRIAELFKVQEDMVKSLASTEDVADVVAIYQDLFAEDTQDASVALQDQAVTLPSQLRHLSDGDPGVEIESRMSKQELAKELGFDTVALLPNPFTRFKHLGGLNQWNSPKDAEIRFVTGTTESKDPTANLNKCDQDLEPISLHYHQVAAIRAVVRQSFSQEPKPQSRGTLIADEVGLGKTYQAAGVISVLADLISRAKFSKAGSVDVVIMPPFVRMLTFQGDGSLC